MANKHNAVRFGLDRLGDAFDVIIGSQTGSLCGLYAKVLNEDLRRLLGSQFAAVPDLIDLDADSRRPSGGRMVIFGKPVPNPVRPLRPIGEDLWLDGPTSATHPKIPRMRR